MHGFTYDSRYWALPDPSAGSDRYNYTTHANKAGFATLAIDRIGSGRSSHPPSATVTLDSNAYTVHQVVSALRAGTVGSQGRFDRVVYVGHSYGTLTGWREVSRYRDVDAAVFTGGSDALTVSSPLVAVPNLLYPAGLDPQFAGRGLDPGYITTMPGSRDDIFYAPARADPAVLAYDEATKQTITTGEIVGFVDAMLSQHDVRVPTLLVNGSLDSLFCRENNGAAPTAIGGVGVPVGPALDAVLRTTSRAKHARTPVVRPDAGRCDSPESLIADQRAHLGANIPSLNAFILSGAGHDLNQALNAPQYFAAVQTWLHQLR